MIQTNQISLHTHQLDRLIKSVKVKTKYAKGLLIVKLMKCLKVN